MKAFALVLALLMPAAAAVNPYTQSLNTAVNAMLDAAQAGNHQATKVVPIVTLGGGSAGFAQVTGSGYAVSRTIAVVEIRASGGTGQVTLLVPAASIARDSGTFVREYGVGVDALVGYTP